MNNKMKLSWVGKIINTVWKNLPKYYSNCVLDEFVIMPNHIHGIIYIKNTSGNKKHTLSDIVRSFKSFSTREINRVQKTPKNLLWQTRFYENIVRDGNALESIRQYIRNNPLKWYRDRNNFYFVEKKRRVSDPSLQ